MKQLFSLLIIFSFITASSRAQDSLHTISPKTSAEYNHYSLPQKNSKEYNLEKSSKLNTTAWVLLGGGIVMGLAGTLIIENAHTSNGWAELSNDYGGGLLVFAGSALVITSVPVFIRSGYYKRKASNVSATLKFEPYQSGLAMKQYPAVGLRISL